MSSREELELCTENLRRARDDYDDLLAIFSHDLRPPLVNIRGFIAEIHDHLKELDSPDETRDRSLLRLDIKEALDYIGASAQRIGRTVDDLLRLRQCRNRELELQRIEPRHLAKILRASGRGVRIRIGPIPPVTADSSALETIFSELVRNALAALEGSGNSAGGEISVRGERRESHTLFEVRDNGPGIEPGDLRRIFKPFRGGTHSKGRGMGLCCAEALVQAHRGRMWCESQPGVGSTFSFTIAHL